MHPLYRKADKLSSGVIGAAIEVHRHEGPGLIESIYERCMPRELELRSIPATTQKLVRVKYKGLVFDEPLRFDVLVDDCLLVELKAVEILHPSSTLDFRHIQSQQTTTFVSFVIFCKDSRLFFLAKFFEMRKRRVRPPDEIKP